MHDVARFALLVMALSFVYSAMYPRASIVGDVRDVFWISAGAFGFSALKCYGADDWPPLVLGLALVVGAMHRWGLPGVAR